MLGLVAPWADHVCLAAWLSRRRPAQDLKPDRVLSVRFRMVEKRYALAAWVLSVRFGMVEKRYAAWLPKGAGTDLKPERVLSVRFGMVEKRYGYVFF